MAWFNIPIGCGILIFALYQYAIGDSPLFSIAMALINFAIAPIGWNKQ